MRITKDDIKILFGKDEIKRRIKELGKEITDFYREKTDRIHAVCVLKGAVHFFSELVLNIDLDVVYSFIHVSSYHGGTSSSGRIKVKSWIDENIENEYVLLVEDVIDTGLTVKYIMRYLRKYHPKDLRLVALVEKTAHDHGVVPDFVGFRVQDQFLIGYGLDYEEVYRNIPYIGYVEL